MKNIIAEIELICILKFDWWLAEGNYGCEFEGRE
jgi:hypothetical protein